MRRTCNPNGVVSGTEVAAMRTLDDANKEVQQFKKGSLRQHVSSLEKELVGKDKTACPRIYSEHVIGSSLLDSAVALKRAAGQVNEVVHAIGILLSLPHILRDEETIQSLSLAAGNTGKPFDLETNLRVAEFKFIDWKGGPESIRQNSLFKDFYLLAEVNTSKERYLYVNGAERPLKFLNSGRSLKSVVAKKELWEEFQRKYGIRFSVVGDYYSYRKSLVQLVDLASIVPYFGHGTEL